MDNNKQNLIDNNKKSKSSNNSNCSNNLKNNKKGFGLSNFSYADYIILSSVLAYSIGEELNDEDLDFVIIFLSQMSSDLALLRTKRGYDLKKLAANQGDIDAIDATLAQEDAQDLIVSNTTRCKIKKKKIKKKKIKKKNIKNIE